MQEVVAVRNVVTHDLTWFNTARRNKPQNFTAAAAASHTALDPTKGDPAACDFCSWDDRTAKDIFPNDTYRIEGPHCVSASNLFKYTAPRQGVVAFKHHDPLCFTRNQVADLLNVADGWFAAAAAAEGTGNGVAAPLHPLLIWNCLPRAGASQFHGHAQTILSAVPQPTQAREAAARQQYNTVTHPGEEYYADFVAAHAALGLATSWGREGEAAVAVAALCPWRDAEIVVHGASLRCGAFQTLVFVALRTLIDELGVQSFNAGIHNILVPGAVAVPAGAPVVARIVSRGRLSSAASDFGGLEVFGGASIGHTDPFQVKAALDAVLSRQS